MTRRVLVDAIRAYAETVKEDVVSMERSDPIPDDKQCSRCGQRLIFYEHGLSTNRGPRDSRFKCPDDHEVWTYAPASKTWRLDWTRSA